MHGTRHAGEPVERPDQEVAGGGEKGLADDAPEVVVQNRRYPVPDVSYSRIDLPARPPTRHDHLPALPPWPLVEYQAEEVVGPVGPGRLDLDRDELLDDLEERQ